MGSAIGVLIGLSDADLDRAVVNHELAMTLAFIAVLVGVVLGVFASLVPRGVKPWAAGSA